MTMDTRLRVCSIIEDGRPCEKPVIARGWCRMHYNRWRRNGDPLITRKRGPARYGAPDRILAVMECEGGWWTKEALMLRLTRSESIVHRALYRLRNEGLIESRRLEGRLTEWRLL